MNAARNALTRALDVVERKQRVLHGHGTIVLAPGRTFGPPRHTPTQGWGERPASLAVDDTGDRRTSLRRFCSDF